MNFCVHAVGTSRATVILNRVHTAFFNYNYFHKMTNMPHEIVLAKIMTALDLEFERAMHYHVKGFDFDNEYGLQGPFMRPVCIYLVSTTEASLNPMDYRGTQGPTSPSTARQTKEEMPLCWAFCWQLTFSVIHPSQMDSNNEEDFLTAELDDSVWLSRANRQWLCIQLIPCSSITSHTTRPATPPPQPIQKEVPQEAESMDVSIPDDLLNVIDVPEELYSDYVS